MKCLILIAIFLFSVNSLTNAQNAQLLKDILPGTTGSELGQFYKFKNKLLFTANDSVHGYELWVTDGTPGNTYILIDGLEILNNGGSDAHNIFTTVSCTDPNIVITDNTVNFFDMLASSGDWSYDEFMFDVLNPSVTGYLTLDVTLACFEGAFPQTFLVYLDCTTASIAEQLQKNHISISPNPSNGNFSIASDARMNKIALYDMKGKLIKKQAVTGNIHNLNVSDIQEGIYQVVITKADNHNTYEKLVISKCFFYRSAYL